MTPEQIAYEAYWRSLNQEPMWENETKEFKAAWTAAINALKELQPTEPEQYQTGFVKMKVRYKLYIENEERKIDYIVNGADIGLEDTQLVGMDESVAAANNLAVISDTQLRMQSAKI